MQSMESAWKAFEQSGKIQDYLAYCAACHANCCAMNKTAIPTSHKEESHADNNGRHHTSR